MTLRIVSFAGRCMTIGPNLNSHSQDVVLNFGWDEANSEGFLSLSVRPEGWEKEWSTEFYTASPEDGLTGISEAFLRSLLQWSGSYTG